jgi:DNA-binding transcriptional LysR family regulator
LLTLDTMRAFTALVEEASFTGAASRLNATQSGVSQKIKKLERHLGVRLVERSPRGAAPTPAGRALYARCLAVLREVSSMATEIGALGQGHAGRVEIGIMAALTRSLVGPVLRAYLADNPNARVNVVERPAAELIDLVAADALDAAIVPTFDAPDSIRCRSLGRTPEVLVSRPGPGARHLQPVALRALPPLRLILQSPGHIRRHRVVAQLRAHGVEIEALMELDSMFATLEYVSNSDFVTVLPAVMVAPEIAGGGLCVRPLVREPVVLDVVMIERASRGESGMVGELGVRVEAALAEFSLLARA